MAFGDNAVRPEWDFGHDFAAVSGDIVDFDGVGLIRLDVTAGVTYNLCATTFSTIFSDDARIIVYDAGGNVLLEPGGVGGYTATLAYAAAASGPVYVGISNMSGVPSPYDFFV